MSMIQIPLRCSLWAGHSSRIAGRKYTLFESQFKLFVWIEEVRVPGSPVDFLYKMMRTGLGWYSNSLLPDINLVRYLGLLMSLMVGRWGEYLEECDSSHSNRLGPQSFVSHFGSDVAPSSRQFWTIFTTQWTWLFLFFFCFFQVYYIVSKNFHNR